MKPFLKWSNEKKKALNEEAKEHLIDNHSLITRLDMAEQIYAIYIKEEFENGRSENEE